MDINSIRTRRAIIDISTKVDYRLLILQHWDTVYSVAYTYKINDLYYSTHGNDFALLTETERNISLNINYTSSYQVRVELLSVGNYSCLQASFYLKRRIGFFILQTYIPSMLIVILSWVGFWVNKHSEPARIALGVTTVLTMTTQLTTSRSNTMRVSYLKAIDVWYSACMLFVFSALIEFAFVNVSLRQENKLLDRAKKFDDDIVSDAYISTSLCFTWSVAELVTCQ